MHWTVNALDFIPFELILCVFFCQKSSQISANPETLPNKMPKISPPREIRPRLKTTGDNV